MLDLPQAIGAYRASHRTVRHAVADNFDWDERLGAERRAAYAAFAAPDGPDPFAEHHAAYVRTRIETAAALPETFAAINATAHRTVPDEDQRIVRLEAIDWILDGEGAEGLNAALLADWVAALERPGMRADAPEKAEAREGIQFFLDIWNERRDQRPMFAAFHDEVAGDLDGAGWEIRLRDRLGLGHYHVGAGMKPRAVALMVYKVADVLRGRTAPERDSTFAVPTALDGGHNAFFFPAPLKRPDPADSYGRTLHLEAQHACDHLVAEILHRRVDYRPNHLKRIGIIGGPIPGASLKGLRNDHLFCLQLLNDREDFGQAIPDHVLD